MADDYNHFSQELLSWYTINKRDLPWRKENIDPYHVVISEIMLQQTQVPRVIEKFKEFIALFPTIQDLAGASSAKVIKAWQGLGYNRRALLLQRFAQEVVKKYEGVIPHVPEALCKLPGVGSYTAGAIASFAFNRSEPAIDVNVRRIFMRFFDGKDQGLPMDADKERKLYARIKKSIPEGRSKDFHNALMDFGSFVCLRENPLCFRCPLRESCCFFPLYDVQKEKALFVAEKKIERGMYESGKYVPHRIFRGRIVEFVRKNEGRTLSLSELGCLVKKDFAMEQKEWLLELCKKLQMEGLITFQVKNDQVTFLLGKT